MIKRAIVRGQRGNFRPGSLRITTVLIRSQAPPILGTGVLHQDGAIRHENGITGTSIHAEQEPGLLDHRCPWRARIAARLGIGSNLSLWHPSVLRRQRHASMTIGRGGTRRRLWAPVAILTPPLSITAISAPDDLRRHEQDSHSVPIPTPPETTGQRTLSSSFGHRGPAVDDLRTKTQL